MKLNKKHVSKVLLACSVPLVMSCARCDQAFKGCSSEVYGLDRDLVAYSWNGTEIKRWHTRSTVDYNADGSVAFLVNGKRVHVQGAIIVDEER